MEVNKQECGKYELAVVFAAEVGLEWRTNQKLSKTAAATETEIVIVIATEIETEIEDQGVMLVMSVIADRSGHGHDQDLAAEV